jgi:hypothetical protein
MRKRWLLNLTLLGIILVLVALVIYTNEQQKPTEQPKLTDLEAGKVQNIRIERADKAPISLMKDALGFWQMTAPFNLPANTYQVERLLQTLSARDYKSLEADNLNLADFKLSPPLATVKFDQLTVAFGDNSPLEDGQRYVRVNQKIYLLTDTLYYLLSSDALTFANRSLLGNNPKITELKMPDYHLLLKEDKWTVTTALPSDEIDTSQDALNALIDRWQHASAYDIERYDANSQTQGEIAITLLGQEQPLHLTIVSKTPDLVLARPEKGVQYKLSVIQVDKLLHLPTEPKSTKSEDKAASSEDDDSQKDTSD